jgi:asparagine synthase (glutamine-hydrolysing)
MCGLVASLHLDGGSADPEQIRRMTDMIRHRGPDDDGYFVSGPVGLGFRRLSILDLSPAGHQPMTATDAQVTIVFNGEIYNFVELRRELEALGHQFRSSGDTEVLLRSYLQWGQGCVARLNGMWAFVIHDRRENLLFGSRDRFGIKPLYRYQAKDRVLFASEIKAIRASGAYQGKTNWSVAAAFLLQGRLDETSQSFYQDIVQVGPGCAFELTHDGRYREWRYWSLEAITAEESHNPAADYAELFEDAVRLHMRSDVPVGVHLSGGLDSSSIICASARIRKVAGATDPLMAFCYQSKDFDESIYIDATLGQTQASMERLETDANRLWDDLPRVLWFQDEPVHSMTAAVSYQLMELTALRGLKVVLNGQGADETAAGYPSYFVNYWHSLMRRGELHDAWSEIASYSAIHGRSAGMVFARQLQFLARTFLARSSGYRNLSRLRAGQRLHSHPWISREIADHLLPLADAVSDERLWPVLASSVYHKPLPLYLRVEDRNSSAHSIEVRVPFLDYRLVELLFRLPDNWRMRGPWNKYIQREAMRGRIPEVVRARVDKMGFPTSAQQWFAGPLYEPLRDLLDSQQTRERGIYDVDAVLANLDSHRKGEQMISGQVFDLAEFELWCRQSERPQSERPVAVS